MSELPVALHPIDRERAFGDLVSFAARHKLTLYDAIYLDLAHHLELPLVTLDRELANAANSIGVEVIS
jgi:predicted nucleic acid-binding protein